MSDKRDLSDKTSSSFPLGRHTIGRYELLSFIARGGMATVYLGRLSGMAGFEKLVAVKVIHPHLADEEEFVGMFLDEARLSAKIHHQNATEIFEVGEEDGLYFMVAELVQGRSLKDLMAAANRERIRLEPRLYLSIIAKVCDALHSAHMLKDYDGTPLFLVHRDISPSNILLSFDGNVKLIDFGIASARERITATRSGVLKGKSGYLAPEQLNGERADLRFDVFSLGVVLYLMTTGRHPFPGDTEGERIHRTLNISPPSPRSIVPDVPAELEGIIDKALQKEPEHRYQSAYDMGQDIRKLLDTLGGLMDSLEIAELMSSLFAEEISLEKKKLEQAIALRAESGRELPGARERRGALADATPSGENKRTDAPEDPVPSSLTGASVPGTEVMGRPVRAASQKRTPKRWLLILASCALGAVLVLALFWYLELTKHGEAEKEEPRETEAASLDNLPETVAPNPVSNLNAIADARPGPKPGNGEESIPQPELAPAPPAKKVKIRLRGLPEVVTVLLAGKDVNVTNGNIAVPADGRPRELELLAKGYEPYSRTIAPRRAGALTVRMRKKGSVRSKKGYTEAGKGKTKLDGNLMECPYCKK